MIYVIYVLEKGLKSDAVVGHLQTHPLRLSLLIQCHQIYTLQCSGESGLSEHFVHLVSTSDDGPFRGTEVFVFFEAGTIRVEYHLIQNKEQGRGGGGVGGEKGERGYCEESDNMCMRMCEGWGGEEGISKEW